MHTGHLSFLLLPLLVASPLWLGGCAANPKANDASYDTLGKDPQRDTERAKTLNARAIPLIEKGDLNAAEPILKEALVADVMYGPAHNNLGKVYYNQGRLYLAAWEFSYAAKLMQHQPEPRNNLGLVFEASGKIDQAVQEYGEALRLEPDNPQFIGNTARARLRRGDKDHEVKELLSKLVVRDSRPDWVEWAREWLTRLRASDATGTPER
jgi:Tfp pilus assembly protein PilF